MGVFSIIFGVAIFAGGIGLGFLIPTIKFSSFSGGPLVAAFNMSTSPLPYLAVFGFIGFMIGFSFVMKGLIYIRLNRLNRRSRRNG